MDSTTNITELRRSDRIGLRWLREVGPHIKPHLDEIDLVEVLADHYLFAKGRELSALKLLASHIPVHLHTYALGLASAHNVSMRQVDNVARLVEYIAPASWSEHLGFVRVRRLRVGHLCAPPRNAHTLAGLVRNVKIASTIIGSKPALENVTFLYEPPCCKYDETDWITRCIATSGAPLLLDLHSLYASAVNAGRDPLADLTALPLHRVTMVHVSGGATFAHGVGGYRSAISSAHRHSGIPGTDDDISEPVLSLLTALGRRASQSLDVVIEQNNNVLPIATINEQVRKVRLALLRGRQQYAAFRPKSRTIEIPVENPIPGDARFARHVEICLANVLAGIESADTSAIADLLKDRVGLELAYRHCYHKRIRGDRPVGRPNIR